VITAIILHVIEVHLLPGNKLLTLVSSLDMPRAWSDAQITGMLATHSYSSGALTADCFPVRAPTSFLLVRACKAQQRWPR
jgi:hypothetical protein